MDNLLDLLSEYGCYIDKFTDIDTLESLMNHFNKISSINNIEYVSCKADTGGIFVLVTNKYVVKLYSSRKYNKIVYIYDTLLSTNYDFSNIEIINYYYSVDNGIVIHDTYHSTQHIIGKSSIRATINELLIPIFYFTEKINTNIEWNKDTTKKFFLDIAKALIELHKNGIVHGDTNPDNIGYRESNNNFVLFDFGDSIIYETDSRLYLSDVNRFLTSILSTYREFFKDYIPNIETIQTLVNKGEYNIEKFYNTINVVMK